MTLRSRFARLAVGGVLATSIAGFAAAGTAAASPGRPFNSATGNVYLANPNQQLTFNAFSGKTAGSIGMVTYSNFNANLTYTAAVTSAVVDESAKTACFTYIIPPGNFVSGIEVTWKVHDGGSPGTKDTAGYKASRTTYTPPTANECAGLPVTNYTITAGNLVVH